MLTDCAVSLLQLTILSTATLLAETIWRVHSESSVIKLM
jgi:phosphoribosylpyrophosphate synthetase